MPSTMAAKATSKSLERGLVPAADGRGVAACRPREEATAVDLDGASTISSLIQSLWRYP